MPYEVTGRRTVTHKVDGTMTSEWLRGAFDSFQEAMLALGRLQDELPWSKSPPEVLALTQEFRIINLETDRPVSPSRRQWRWANQHRWPSDRASWIWPGAEETESDPT